MTEIIVNCEYAGNPPAFTGRGFIGSDLCTFDPATPASAGANVMATASTFSGGVAVRFVVGDSWLTLTNPASPFTGKFVGPITKSNNLPAE